jgi:hypothetical protein
VALGNRHLETLTWLLIYSGLLIAGLGVFVLRGGEAMFGWALMAVGAADALAGVGLLWHRSRRPDPPLPRSQGDSP